MRYIIDRFEGKYAVLEDENKNMVDVLKTNLPNNAKEGDVLDLNDNVYSINKDETRKRKERIEKSMDDLWE